MKSPVFSILCSCLLLMLVVCPLPAFGGTFTMTDQNSQAVVNPSSQAGMQSWTVDGVDQLRSSGFGMPSDREVPAASIRWALPSSLKPTAARSQSPIPAQTDWKLPSATF